MAYFLMSVFLHLRFSVSVSPHVHVLVCLSLYSGLYICLQSGLWLVGQSVTVFPITRSSGNLVYIMAVLLSVFVYAYCTKLNSLIHTCLHAHTHTYIHNPYRCTHTNTHTRARAHTHTHKHTLNKPSELAVNS